MRIRRPALTILVGCGLAAAVLGAPPPDGAVPRALQAPQPAVAAPAQPAPAHADTTVPAATAGSADKTADKSAAKAVPLAALLGQEPGQYDDSVRCIASLQVDETEVLSAQLIVFGNGKRVWINQLPGKCPGLMPGAKIAVESNAAYRYCSFDGVHVLNYFGPSSLDNSITSLGPGCFLGRFEPISKAQLAVLREHYTPRARSLVDQLNDRERQRPKH